MKTGLLSLVLLALSMSITVFAEEAVPGPGDLGYKHDDYHLYYQEVFDQLKCQCAIGECRPTTYRQTSVGVEIKLSGSWVQVPDEAIIDPDGVPSELWREPAHVCATEYGKTDDKGASAYKIECVLINSGI